MRLCVSAQTCWCSCVCVFMLVSVSLYMYLWFCTHDCVRLPMCNWLYVCLGWWCVSRCVYKQICVDLNVCWCMHCVSLCVLWPCDYVHGYMFSYTCDGGYIHIYPCVSRCCVWWFVSLCVSMCLTVGTCMGMSLFLWVSTDLCSEPPIHMHTVPSSGPEKKAPQDWKRKKGKKAGSETPPIPDWSVATYRAVSSMAPERAGEGQAPTSWGTLQGPALGSCFIVWQSKDSSSVPEARSASTWWVSGPGGGSLRTIRSQWGRIVLRTSTIAGGLHSLLP